MNNNEFEEVKSLFFSLTLPVQVIRGGSHSIGVATGESDKEYYIIARSWIGLLQLLAKKKQIQQEKEKRGIVADFLLSTRFLVRSRFYYVLGIDEDGNELAVRYDRRLMRNTSLKMGLRAFLDARKQMRPLRKQYLLSKAAIQLSYTYALETNQVPAGQLFTPHGATAIALDRSFPVEGVASAIDLKFKEQSVDVKASEEALKELIAKLKPLFEARPWSIRAYSWQCLFALREGRLRDMMRYADKEQIEALFAHVVGDGTVPYQQLRPTLLKGIII